MRVNIFYQDNKKIFRKCYYDSNNILHRSNGPSIYHFYKNGKLKVEMYATDNKFGRLYGPSVITYSKSGEILNKQYYLNDIKYNNEFEYLLALGKYRLK